MKSLPTIAAILALAVPFAGPAKSDPRQDPTAEYAADVVSHAGDASRSVSKIWHAKNKVRVELSRQGQDMAVILDRPGNKMTVLLMKQKLYQEQPLPEGAGLNPIAKGSWEVSKAANETIAGIPTTKWSVSGKGADGRSFKGSIWTTKENIQVKMEGEAEGEGKTVKVLSELQNLKIGPIDPSVFAVPADFRPAPKKNREN